ncbi:hypothetical protein CAEBREN_04809 [Caenorhabditis brenneri]|uniref:RING-type domain-containing protein n=1 Tax=Caenorhabditis brenneri TaxID=135651 RepID=G0MNG6_CAEBE|nr:hypothetical protein CAEBREN_04809 [Caenorhabditis brenneri]
MNVDCGICYDDYDSNEQIPCIGTCGHTICNRCRTSMTSSKCPHCNRKEAFAVKHVNKQLWDLIQFANFIFKKPEVQKENISSDAPRCSRCQEPSKKLRVCQDCCLKSGCVSKFRRESEDEEENVEEVCQRIRDQALCGDCIIDGDHFRHKTEYVDLFIDSYMSFLKNKC